MDIRLNGDGVPYDGKYWIDPENSGNPFPVYCEMSFETGESLCLFQSRQYTFTYLLMRFLRYALFIYMLCFTRWMATCLQYHPFRSSLAADTDFDPIVTFPTTTRTTPSFQILYLVNFDRSSILLG